MLILLLLISGGFNLGSNIVQGDCSESNTNFSGAYCVKGFILSFALPNKRDNEEYLQSQAILNLASVVLILLFFHYFRYQFRKTEIEADDRTVTPSDYTVMIGGIPSTASNKEIEKWIRGLATEGEPLQVARIVRSFRINQYIQLVNKNSKLIKQRAILKNKKGINEAIKKEKLKEFDKEIDRITEELKIQKEGGLVRCPVVFVTMKTAQRKSLFPI